MNSDSGWQKIANPQCTKVFKDQDYNSPTLILVTQSNTYITQRNKAKYISESWAPDPSEYVGLLLVQVQHKKNQQRWLYRQNGNSNSPYHQSVILLGCIGTYCLVGVAYLASS